MGQLRLTFGWSALLIILLVPMGVSMRWVAIMCLFVALMVTELLRIAQEIVEDADRDG